MLEFFLKRNKTHLSKYNYIKEEGVDKRKTEILVKGSGNKILIDGGGTTLIGCSIFISGNNNVIHVSSGCKLSNVSLYMEDDCGRIDIGRDTVISGNTHIAVIEGKKVTIGERCLFSSNITIRTGDSHSILNMEGLRINPSKDVVIADHVWIGNTVIILKGTIIHSDSVVAAGSVLAGGEFPGNSIVGGVGGHVLKSEIDWCERRLPIRI